MEHQSFHTCGSITECFLRYTKFLFLFGSLYCVYIGWYLYALCHFLIFSTSILKYWYPSPRHDTIDSYTVFTATSTVFAFYGFQIANTLCLLYNIIVFIMFSRWDCLWHSTIHMSSFLATILPQWEWPSLLGF